MAYPIIDGPYGLQPANLRGGIPFAGSTRMIPIGQGYNTGLFAGDVVGISNGNTIITPYNANTASGAAAGAILGVFLGFEPAITSGVRATSADGVGGKFWVATSLAKTNDLTQGGFYVSSAVNDFDFAIGYEPPSANGPDSITNQVYAYFGPLDETVGVARR